MKLTALESIDDKSPYLVSASLNDNGHKYFTLSVEL